MSRGPKVIVAGAGALGLCTALALAEAGCSVTLCDPTDGPQASALAAGMLAPVFEAALDAETGGDLDLLLAARDLWPALAARIGVELDRMGTAAAGSAAWLADVRGRLSRLGVSPEDLSRGEIERGAPRLAPGLAALLVREDWRLDPRAALARLWSAAEAAGVTLRPEAVTGRGDADWLVVATGPGQGLAEVAPELGRLTPIKGQIVSFLDIHEGGLSLRGEGCYAVPGPGGLAVGATMEVGRNDTAIDLATLAPVTQAAERLLPSLAGARSITFAAVRAATPDGLPMVGLSRAPGVILAVGARRNGWLLAPMVGEVVTACVTGRDAGPYAGRFDPARFGAWG